MIIWIDTGESIMELRDLCKVEGLLSNSPLVAPFYLIALGLWN
jgi:hypothetical protein